MRFESSAKKMKEELESIGLAYIRHSHQEGNISRLKKIVRETHNDIERQNVFSMMAENLSLVFYQEIKYKLGREEYIKFCSRNERSETV
jgi:hypothetical protein